MYICMYIYMYRSFCAHTFLWRTLPPRGCSFGTTDAFFFLRQIWGIWQWQMFIMTADLYSNDGGHSLMMCSCCLYSLREQIIEKRIKSHVCFENMSAHFNIVANT